MKIATPRFDLRLLDDGDGALYASLYGDPATMAFVAPALEPARLARALTATCSANMATPPRRRTWVIRDRALARDLGLIGLIWDGAPEGDRHGAELGVMLPPAWQDRGVAREAIAAVCDHAFAELGLAFLHTSHAPDHALAAGLMRRTGFVPQPPLAGEGVRRWRRLRDQDVLP